MGVEYEEVVSMRKFVSTTSTVVLLLSSVVILTNPSAQETELAQIVFHSDRDGNNEIYVMNADGENQRRLTNSEASDDQPTWSPSGQKIAFVSRRDGNFEIYVMRAIGGKQTRLTDNSATDSHPAWFDPRLAQPVEPAGKSRSIWGNIKSRTHTFSP